PQWPPRGGRWGRHVSDRQRHSLARRAPTRQGGIGWRLERDPAMKVVLFCGGLGTRLAGNTDDAPKPMVKIGYRPILWHVMKYYAHFGHRDFILCLGYRADTIKDYFLNYDETHSNNFTMTRGGRDIALESSDLDEWRITFVDTGLTSNIGQRL